MPCFCIPTKPALSSLPSATVSKKNQILFTDKTFTACKISKLSDDTLSLHEKYQLFDGKSKTKSPLCRMINGILHY